MTPMTRKTIAIRTRGSAQIGSGHIRRMAILARYLKARDYVVLLICNPDALSVFPPAAAAFDTIVEVENEAQSVAVLKAHTDPLAAVFFDDYGLNAVDHTAYRTCAPLLAGIDDLASRPVDWDVLFDINLGRSRADYDGLIADKTIGFFGADYQIIQPVFFDLQAGSLARDRWPLGRVFISLGGTDPFNLTSPILTATFAALPDCQIDVVSGSMSPHFGALKTTVDALGARVTLHADAQNVADLMCAADLAIGAGGTMTWERNALGVPSVVLVIADNQLQVGDAMRAADAAIVIDARETYCETDLKTALAQISADRETLGRLSRNARKLGGANGAENIAKCLDREIRKQT